MLCHEEDPAIKGGIDGGAKVAGELDPQGNEQGPGSVGAPGCCCGGVGIGLPPSRDGSGPGTGPAARGSDAPASQVWASAGSTVEAQVRAAPKQRVSFLICVVVLP